MEIPDIRDIIREALRREHETAQLRAAIEQRLPQLRRKLLLPEQDPLSALMAFITGYIESVPRCLALVASVSRRLGFFEYAAPFLRLAEDYFLKPPDALPRDGGLESLLDEAFLAHRLLEEVNDHHIRHLQRPLLPLDLTEANTIVHHLLGDELATRLEQLVQHTAAQLLRHEYVWARVQGKEGAWAPSTPLVSSESLGRAAGRVRLRLAS